MARAVILPAGEHMTDKTAAMVRAWVDSHGGDLEAVARFMAYSLRIGGIAEARGLISEALRPRLPLPEPETIEAAAAGMFADALDAPPHWCMSCGGGGCSDCEGGAV